MLQHLKCNLMQTTREELQELDELHWNPTRKHLQEYYQWFCGKYHTKTVMEDEMSEVQHLLSGNRNDQLNEFRMVGTDF